MTGGPIFLQRRNGRIGCRVGDEREGKEAAAVWRRFRPVGGFGRRLDWPALAFFFVAGVGSSSPAPGLLLRVHGVMDGHESSFSRRRIASSFVPPQTVPVKMEVEDAELACILPTLDDVASFVPGDFVNDNHLCTVLGLMSKTSRCEAEKAEEWQWSRERSTAISSVATTSEAIAASPPRQKAPFYVLVIVFSFRMEDFPHEPSC
ncbi:hypothetical protein QYE76_025750 [Lolium multiflorum]|uniref:Uncharacterized protein n=1 Tax=Lolium multiflorum TaxID=4521 RepID=A0AAD8RJ73_LOLMU|nr:hypothetical protein QYE76_025750 [Lolium multiflorum]